MYILILKVRFNFNVENCGFCTTHLETTKHLFYECKEVLNLWDQLRNFLSSKTINLDFVSLQNIQFGLFIKDKNLEFLVNVLIIATKYYIHKCRYAKCSLSINAFKNELSFSRSCIKKMHNLNAVKLYELMRDFSL